MDCTYLLTAGSQRPCFAYWELQEAQEMGGFGLIFSHQGLELAHD